MRSKSAERVDKLRVDSLNRYLYTVNNPVNFVDPSGLEEVMDTMGDDLQSPTLKSDIGLGIPYRDNEANTLNDILKMNHISELNIFNDAMKHDTSVCNEVNAINHPEVYVDQNPNQYNDYYSGLEPSCGEVGDVYGLVASTTGKYAGNLTLEQMNNNAKYIYRYLSNIGWSINAIAAVLGNMQWESGSINPGAWEVYNNSNGGYGLVQWTPATNFFDWASLTVETANELVINETKKMIDLQLEYLIFDLKPERGSWGDYAKKLSAQGYDYMTVFDFSHSELPAGILAKYFEALYERSADEIGGKAHNTRVKYANDWQEFFSNMGGD